jgi:ABC-type uncharacterized transport system substrate-binding protein
MTVVSGQWSQVSKGVFFLALCFALCVICFSAEAQQPEKITRIGYLSPSAELSRLDGFRGALRDLGYVEGKNIVIEYRSAEGKFDRLPDLAAELVRMKVDVIVATGSPGTEAARQASRTIPIVMNLVGDPVPRFVASLAKPGGNITGLTQLAPQLSGKRLELLKEAFPKIARVAVIDDAALTAEQLSGNSRETQATAEVLGIQLQSFEVKGPNPDLDGVFKAATRQRADALVMMPGPSLIQHKKRIVGLATKSRLPAIYATSEFVEVGGLMSYATDYVDLYRRAAVYVDKIIKGRKPYDLPVEQPTKFEFVINLKTAKQIGLAIQPNVLARADRVIR